MKITRGIIASAQKVVIYGPEGIGKSTFAAQFPDPLFIDTEGSTKNMDIARMDKPTSWTMLKNQMASLILDKLSKRRDAGLTTPKQIRFLEGKGFRHVGTWQFETARHMIDRIAANGWCVPFDVDPYTYTEGRI